jgi:hypothetical protein
MPRKSRIDAAGAIHHVIARGINRISEYKTAGAGLVIEYNSIGCEHGGRTRPDTGRRIEIEF